jgi:hypothetical protein
MAGYTKLNLRDDVDDQAFDRQHKAWEDMIELRPFDAIRVGGGWWGG